MLPRPYLSHPVAAVESGERAACIRLHETCVANHLDGEARRQPAFDLPFGHEDPSLFRRVYVRGSRVSTRFVCPRITGPPKTFKASVVARPHFCLWLQADIQRRAVRGLLSARKRTLANRISQAAHFTSAYRSEADIERLRHRCLVLTQAV